MGKLDRVLGAGLVIDREYRVTDGNGRCEVIFRDTFDRVEGKTLETLQDEGLFDSHTLQTWEHAITEVLAGETKERTEQVTLIPFGSDEGYPYDLAITPLATEGYPDEVCCSLRSVGPSQRYGETITALETATRELMTADDVDEVLHRAAVAANDVLGFPGIGVRKYDPEAELLRFVSFGARVRDIDTRPPYPVEGTSQGRAFRESETVIDDIEDEDPYDREVFTQTMYLPIGNTGVLGVGTIGKPFTETDVQFAEILTEHAAAAIRVVDTTSTLREERENLELLRQILTRALRHNLRNEMSVIRTNAELLRERTDDAGEEFVDSILSSVENVAALSDKAELFEQVTADYRPQQRVDLEATVSEAVARVTRQYPDASLEVDCEPVTVRAHSALDVAVGNLLENACEHAGGTVSVTTTGTDGHVVLSVVDDGPGIPGAEVEVLESRNETALEHGSGLGLWVVDWIVKQSDGTLEFDTTDGTRVDVTLPVAETEYSRSSTCI